MDEFPLWLKLIIYTTFGLTVLYLVGGMFLS
jgi:hypothetical protein